MTRLNHRPNCHRLFRCRRGPDRDRVERARSILPDLLGRAELPIQRFVGHAVSAPASVAKAGLRRAREANGGHAWIPLRGITLCPPYATRALRTRGAPDALRAGSCRRMPPARP